MFTRDSCPTQKSHSTCIVADTVDIRVCIIIHDLLLLGRELFYSITRDLRMFKNIREIPMFFLAIVVNII